MPGTVIVASQNPVKIAAVKAGFDALFTKETFTVEGISVDSGVPDQPFSNQETLTGARQRAANARLVRPDADYIAGVEGGLEETAEGMEAFAWVVIDDGERQGISRTATFYLPQRVIQLIHEGHELGTADDIVFKKNNSKQDTGSVGILTGDVVTRTTYYKQAVILALIPFHNPELDF